MKIKIKDRLSIQFLKENKVYAFQLRYWFDHDLANSGFLIKNIKNYFFFKIYIWEKRKDFDF